MSTRRPDPRMSVSLPSLHVAATGRKPNPHAAETAEIIARLIDEGFGVEFRPLDADGQPLDTRGAEAMRRLCESAASVTVHTSVYGWEPVRLRRELAFAATVGSSVLIVHPVRLSLDEPQPDFLAAAAICAEARDLGVRILLENVPSGLATLRNALDAIGWEPAETGLGILIDVGHANISYALDGVEPARFLEELRDVICEVHLHDNDGQTDQHCLPGEGTLDWDALWPGLRSLRDDTIYCLELAFGSFPWKELARVRDTVAEALAGGSES